MRAIHWQTGQSCSVQIPAKVDYGIRALLALAAADAPETTEYMAGAQSLPPRFLGAILTELRRAGILASQRGPEGGYRLARRASEITIADVIRALDGPLAEVRGFRPELAHYDGAAENLQQVWVAVRASLRSVLEKVTLADVIAGSLPANVRRLTANPDAWVSH
jgi:Rrf2 family protein